MPEMVLSVVLLPAPLLPIRLTISPGPTVMEMPCSTAILPYPAWTLTSSSIGGARSEIRIDDFGMNRRFSGGPVEYLASVVDHDDAVTQAHHHAHVVLDHDHGEPGDAQASDPVSYTHLRAHE